MSPAERSRDFGAPVIVFLVALAVRAIYFAQAGDDPLFSVLLGDGFRYDAWARQIATGDWLGKDAFYQAPLYPYLLAGLHKLSGGDVWVVRWIQALLGALACLLVAVAGRRFFSRQAGLLAGLMLALFPPAVFFDGLVQKTTVGLFLMTLWLVLLAPGNPRSGGRRALVAGLVLGCLALVRENALLLVPVGAGWLVWRAGVERRRRLPEALLFLLGFCLALAPVMLRNLAVSGELVVTTSQSGPNFYIGNHAGANGKYMPLVAGRGDAQVERADAVALAEAASGRDLGPAEVSRYWWSRAWSWIRAEPAAWARLMVKKGWLVWHADEIVDSDSIEAYAEASSLLSGLYRIWHFGVLLPLAVAGVWLTRSRWRDLWLLYAGLGVIAAGVAVFYVLARYRFPLVPVLALFGGAALTVLWRRLRERRWREIATALAAALVIALVVNWPLAADADPRATTYLNLGLALTDAGRQEEALAALDRARLLERDFAPIDEARAAALLGMAQTSALGGDLEAARRHLASALQADPESAMAHGLIANLLAHEGDLAAARRHYERALALEPELADARFKLGVLLLDMGRAGEAVDHLREAVRLLPDYAPASEALASAMEAMSSEGSGSGPRVLSAPESQ